MDADRGDDDDPRDDGPAEREEHLDGDVCGEVADQHPGTDQQRLEDGTGDPAEPGAETIRESAQGDGEQEGCGARDRETEADLCGGEADDLR